MKTKKYSLPKPAVHIAHEPVAAYGTAPQYLSVIQDKEDMAYTPTQHEMDAIMRAKEAYARGEYYTEEEMEERMKRWLD
jgi:hypothetical protein